MKQYRAKPETKSVTESDNGIVVFAFLILFCAVWYVLFASIDLEGMHYKMNGLILNPIGIAICWLLLTDVLRITFVNILVSKKQ